MELPLSLKLSETPWEGGLLDHLVDAVGGKSSDHLNIFVPSAIKFVWHFKKLTF